MSGDELRDAIAGALYVRDRFDSPTVVLADAILALPEMQAMLAEIARLRAEVERQRAALRYIERPTMSLGGADPEQHVLVADERAVRLALQTCIRMAREALAVEEARRG